MTQNTVTIKSSGQDPLVAPPDGAGGGKSLLVVVYWFS